jgi:hypothetical protein
MPLFAFNANRRESESNSDSDSEDDVRDDVSDASTIPDDVNPGPRFDGPRFDPTLLQQENRDNGPNKVFTIVGCVIITMFILKEILTIATLCIMLNLLGYAVDPVNTRELHTLNVTAAKRLYRDMQMMREDEQRM